MTSEISQNSELAQQIIQTCVNEFRQQEPNPSLRMLASLCAEIIDRMKQEDLPTSEYPLAAHIGDISPEIDPKHEAEFLWLRDFLGFSTKSQQQLSCLQEQLWQQLETAGVAPSRYDSEVMGLLPTRQLLIEELARYGFVLKPENIRLVDGGTAAYNLAFSTVAAQVFAQDRQPRLLAPSPTYTMATNCTLDKGMSLQLIDVGGLPDQEATAEALLQFHQAQPDFIPDLMYLVPTSNPMATVANPEQLQTLLAEAQKLYPQMQYCFDLAYLGLVPLEKAKAIVSAIQASGVNEQSYFCYSDSKRLMNPGARWGALIAPPALQAQVGNFAKRGSFSTYSRVTDLAWAAMLEQIKNARDSGNDPIAAVIALFRQRQRLLLQYLQQENQKRRLFAELPQNPPDIPLYLWLKLKEGIDAYNVIEQLRIVGVPGSVFGDFHYLRFAVGALPSGLIQARLS